MVDVTLTTVEPVPTAVVRAATTWAEFPAVWRDALDRVWRFLGEAPADLRTDGHNVMLYLDDAPNVEVGVQVTRRFSRQGAVVASTLPGGRVASAVHTGPIDRIGETHDAVCVWCGEHGHVVTRVRWEIYGDPDASGRFSVEVFWALAPATEGASADDSGARA